MAFVALCRERCTLLNVRPANESTMGVWVSSRERGGGGGKVTSERNSITIMVLFTQATVLSAPATHGQTPQGVLEAG